MKIYRACTKEPFSFLTIVTMLPASDPLRFLKKCLILNVFKRHYCKQCIKMTVTDQIKILDRTIMQYDLDRKAAKLSALSSNNLDKYE